MSKKVFTVFSLLLAFVFLVSVAQPAYTSNEGKMRVWVEFSPGRGVKVENALNALGAEFHYRFEDLNSFVVTVPEQALAGLRNNPNVVSIEEDAIRYPASEDYPTIPYGIDMVQSRDVWDNDRNGVVDPFAPTGANRTVCIIDSGLYTGHEDFAGVNILGGYPTDWNTDKCGHGTHVAGTINAALNSSGVVGVNPGTTNLYIVKVFGDDCGWAYSSTLADAANRCEAAGADVISMSLGGAKSNKLEQRAFDNLYSKGVLSIAAAGNEGTTAYNYPASYSSVVSVAAIDESKAWANFSQYNNQVELAAPGVSVLSTVPFLNEASVTVDGVNYDGHPVEYAKLGSAIGALADGGLCTSTGSWAGKVVLCQRGDISFYDKVMNVQNSGGAAAVIFNNVEGELLATLGEGYSSTIPAIGLTQSQGLELLGKLTRSATVENSFTPNVSSYEKWDGTSMATPHVSGVAALIWSAFPNLSNVDIRNALTSTALDLGTGGRDVYYGFGLVQAYDALLSLGWNPISPTPTPTDTPTVTPTTPTPTDSPTPTPEPTGTPTPIVKEMVLLADTDKDTYSDRQTVYITVTATNTDGSPISGASVTITIKKETILFATGSSTTGSNGEVTFTYRIKTRTTGTGEMTVDASASMAGYETQTASTTFTIQ